MNIEDIKVGDFYNYRLQAKQTADTHVILEDAYGIRYRFSRNEIETLSPANGIKNTETTPKYDPKRLFRKGDKVRVVEWNGRNYYDLDHCTKLETGCLAEIWEDEEAEQQEGYVSVIYQEYIRSVPPCFLELVSPVDERVSFRVGDFPVDGEWSVWKDSFGKTEIISSYKIATHPHAKAAAEAECNRLNAEYRKEKK